MAINSPDTLAAGFQPPRTLRKGAFTGEAAGQTHNLSVLAGIPGAWVLGTPGMAGVAVDNAWGLGGIFPFTNPTAGLNAYLAQLSVWYGAAITGITLYDLLWYQSGIAETTTTAQTINSAAWPARSADGTVNGDGVEVWMHCTTATTNGSAVANTTLQYTNQAGTSGRSAGLAYSWPATAVAGTMVPFALQGSDTGVRSIQTGITLGTSYGGGQVELLALRQIASLDIPVASAGGTLDYFGLGGPRLYDGTALIAAVKLTGTGAGNVFGQIIYVWG